MIRWSSLLSEAARNVSSGAALTLQLVFGVGFVLILSIGPDLMSVLKLTEQSYTYRDSGAATQILTAPGRVNPDACEALNHGAGSAGALRKATSQLTATALPSSQIPTFDVSPSFLNILTGTSFAEASSGILLSVQTAEALGVQRGDTLSLLNGDVRVSDVFEYPEDGRRSDLRYALVLPTVDREPFDECWATTWPLSDNLSVSLRATVFFGGDTSEPPQISQLNSSLGREFSGPTDFATRVTGVLPLAGALITWALTFLAARSRRIELASARHLGMSPFSQWAIVMLESTVWVVASLLVSATTVSGFMVRVPLNDAYVFAEIGIRSAAHILAAGLLGATLGVLLSRERKLFTYFKDRR